MAIASFRQFQTLVKQNGLSKANRFKIVIIPPKTLNSPIDLNSVSLLAEAAKLPGKSLNIEKLKIM
jgi:hypothetical protein